VNPRRRARPLVAGAALAALAGSSIAGCLWGRPRATIVEAPLAPAYAGSAACARCHGDAAAAHRGSGHAQTLQRADGPLGGGLKPSAWIKDPILPLTFRVARRNGEIGVEARGADLQRWQPARWLFGSGRHGMTLVAEAGAGRYIELPLSYYPTRGWDLTPGYLANAPKRRLYHPAGVPADHVLFFTCFDCHATAAADTPDDLDLGHLRGGVQCERCHGPGERHVRAAEARQPIAGTIRRFGGASAADITRLCGECHRAQPPPGFPPDAPQLVRFAPVGLQRSRCYRESRGRLSCITCHDPHHDDVGLPARAEKVCLSCHTSPNRLAAHLCPVNRVSGCVGCHMPKAEAARHSLFTDHWIRPHHPGESKSAPLVPSPIVPGVSDH